MEVFKETFLFIIKKSETLLWKISPMFKSRDNNIMSHVFHAPRMRAIDASSGILPPPSLLPQDSPVLKQILFCL